MLVGVPIIPSNDSAVIVLFCQNKINIYVTRLKGSNRNPQDVLFGYERYWLPSLECAALVLTISHSDVLLPPLHKALLQKLKVMGIFPLVMSGAPAAIGGLDLRSLEINSGSQTIHHQVSLLTTFTPSNCS